MERDNIVAMSQPSRDGKKKGFKQQKEPHKSSADDKVLTEDGEEKMGVLNETSVAHSSHHSSDEDKDDIVVEGVDLECGDSQVPSMTGARSLHESGLFRVAVEESCEVVSAGVAPSNREDFREWPAHYKEDHFIPAEVVLELLLSLSDMVRDMMATMVLKGLRKQSCARKYVAFRTGLAILQDVQSALHLRFGEVFPHPSESPPPEDVEESEDCLEEGHTTNIKDVDSMVNESDVLARVRPTGDDLVPGKQVSWEFIFFVCHQKISPIVLLVSLLTYLQKIIGRPKHDDQEGTSAPTARSSSSVNVTAFNNVLYRIDYLRDLILYSDFFLSDTCHTTILDKAARRKSNYGELFAAEHKEGGAFVIRKAVVCKKRAADQSRKRLMKYLNIAVASYTKSSEYRTFLSQQFALCSGFVYYFFRPSSAQLKVHYAHSKDNVRRSVISIWNKLDDKGPIRSLFKVTLPWTKKSILEMACDTSESSHKTLVEEMTSTHGDDYRDSLNVLRERNPAFSEQSFRVNRTATEPNLFYNEWQEVEQDDGGNSKSVGSLKNSPRGRKTSTQKKKEKRKRKNKRKAESIGNIYFEHGETMDGNEWRRQGRTIAQQEEKKEKDSCGKTFSDKEDCESGREDCESDRERCSEKVKEAQVVVDEPIIEIDIASETSNFTARLICKSAMPVWRKPQKREKNEEETEEAEEAEEISHSEQEVKKKSKKKNKKKVLVVHFHGGGFIAMSSYSHQEYTRKWAQQTGYVILSVDYRLAPKHPYPAAFLDCWDAYLWAVNNIHEYTGDRPDVILVTGDSAGGNLAAAVTVRAICEKSIAVPDGIMLSYPAMILDKYVLMPSRLLTFLDPVVPFAFLQLCMDEYIPTELQSKGQTSKTDPFLSPFIAPLSILAKFPPTIICAGDMDPLFDDALSFARRLQKAGVCVHVTIYPDLPHGYLNFSKLMPVVTRAVRESATMLQKLAFADYSWSMNAGDVQTVDDLAMLRKQESSEL